MDSITHTTLGATLAYLVLGKQLGRKTLLYGALIGNIPDLDILAYPWLDPLQRLQWHRGISHSLFLHALGSIPIAFLIKSVHRPSHTSSASLSQYVLAVFLILSTHALLDACTVYGTQLFSPLTNTRYAWNLIFIIDPIFTLPLIIATAIIAFPSFLKKLSRTLISYCAVLICALYLLSLFFIKQHIDHRFTQARKNQTISTSLHALSAPAFPGPLLWREIVKSPDGCLIAYASLLDASQHSITHSLLPFPPSLQKNWQSHPTIRKLLWFSENHGYIDQYSKNTFLYHDLRFGEIRAAPPEAPLSPQNTFAIFRWKLLLEPDGNLKILPHTSPLPRTSMLSTLWKRLLGYPIM